MLYSPSAMLTAVSKVLELRLAAAFQLPSVVRRPYDFREACRVALKEFSPVENCVSGSAPVRSAPNGSWIDATLAVGTTCEF